MTVDFQDGEVVSTGRTEKILSDPSQDDARAIQSIGFATAITQQEIERLVQLAQEARSTAKWLAQGGRRGGQAAPAESCFAYPLLVPV